MRNWIMAAAVLVGGSAYGQPPAYYAPTPAYAVGGDPAAFLAWLNATRAWYGLRPVGYDRNLEAWAMQNSVAQAAAGLGHYVMGPARRQNSAAGASFPGVESIWMASPLHRAALLDPTITHIGVAWYAGYSTFNAY